MNVCESSIIIKQEKEREERGLKMRVLKGKKKGKSFDDTSI